MRRQHTRTPQVTAPHTSPAHQYFAQHQPATNFFLDRLRNQPAAHAGHNGLALASKAPLWPQAISICSFLILLVSLGMLFLMVMIR